MNSPPQVGLLPLFEAMGPFFWFECLAHPTLGDNGEFLRPGDRIFARLPEEVLPWFDLPDNFPWDEATSAQTVPDHVAFGVFPHRISVGSVVCTAENSEGRPTLAAALQAVEASRHILTVADMFWVLSQIGDRLLEPATFLAPLRPITKREETEEMPKNPVYRVQQIRHQKEGSIEMRWRVDVAAENPVELTMNSPVTVILATYSRPSL
ncbi:hypothetical protein KBB27_00945 [Patescibacteria group bacterium]|nr:hypothetical protein [Patescibacteria group bacterium]